MREKLELLSEFFGLNAMERRLILRVSWVVSVTLILAYMLGALTAIGVSAPFAKAADLQKLQSFVLTSKANRDVQVAKMQETVNLIAKLNIQQELRVQVKNRCRTLDQTALDVIDRYTDNLQNEYESLTGRRYPEGTCK